jgi:asparagine synthase (glutamine-hydrolysing)
MPGIHLLQKKNSIYKFPNNQLSNNDCGSNYIQSVLFKNDSFFVVNSSYEDYPVSHVNLNNILIVIEGYIYNTEKEKIFDYISEMQKNKTLLCTDVVAKRLEKVDGDYIIYIINTEVNEIVIINDQLKRLPLYYFENKDCLICTRDLKFITSNINVTLNKKGLIDYLLFMVPSGNETLHENIFKLDCASILYSTENKFEIQNYHVWNYQEQIYKKNSFQRNHEILTKILVEGMKNRISKINGKNINVLLSGGLDSRTIIAMLSKYDEFIQTHTFLFADKSNLIDYQKSKEIASLVDFQWNGYYIEDVDEENIRKLINLKDAMNYAGVANILSFLEVITKKNEQYYTGDWGRIFKNDFPREKIYNFKELIDYIVNNKAVFKPEIVAEILNIPLEKVYDRIKEIVSSYPETNFKYKYLHFLYHERTLNWLQEGEDRNRKYFWSATPFSNQLLFDYAKNINPKQKISYKLYKKIISNIDSRFLDISYEKIDDIRSLKFVISDKIKLLLGFSPTIKRILKKNKKKEKKYFEDSNEFIKLFRSNRNMDIFKLNPSRNYTKTEIFTLVSLLEYTR